MRIRALPAAAAAVTVVLGAATAVAVAQSSDDTNSDPPPGGTPSSSPRGDTTSSDPLWAEIMNNLPPGAARPAAGKRAVPADFNGDGYRDIATRGPNESQGDLVTIIYGGPDGADPARRQVISAPGDPNIDFGRDRPLQSADFDRDGYADLLTSGSKATPGSQAATTIVYGGPRGLTSRTATLTREVCSSSPAPPTG